MASDFLKFDGFDDFFVHKLDQAFLKFGHDFNRVGDALSDLFVDALKFDDHKISADIVFKHDVDVASHTFISLSSDTIKLDDALHRFDDVILKYADQTLKLDAAGDGGDQSQTTLSDDFKGLDTDLIAASAAADNIGLDTLKLHLGGENGNETFIKWAGDIGKFGDDLQKVGDDFLKVGDDFFKLGHLSDSEAVDQAFIKLGGGALKIHDDLHKVGDDLLKIATDIAGSGDNFGTLKIDQISLKFAEDFHKLDFDLHKLSVDIASLGHDYLKLTDVLAGNERGTVASDTTDSIHQVLQHAHDFSLL